MILLGGKPHIIQQKGAWYFKELHWVKKSFVTQEMIGLSKSQVTNQPECQGFHLLHTYGSDHKLFRVLLYLFQGINPHKLQYMGALPPTWNTPGR